MSTLTRLAPIAVAILLAAVALGQPNQDQLFNRLDANKDGKLSKDEFPERARQFFDRIDADGDGFITREEDTAFRQARGQGQGRQRPQLPPATYADVSYGPHERNVVDFWQAESEQPTPVLVFFHGGGFRAGDKSSMNGRLLEWCLEAGISCAAGNYRLSDTAPYPAQMHDAARAIQFLRGQAEEWNIDPTRFACYGGSAGAGISLWLAMHDDLADPEAEDPIAQQPTRLSCAIGLQAQCTYDPRVIREIIPGPAYNDAALKPFYGLPPEWDWDTAEISDELSALLEDASPIFHLTDDDPPIFVYHRSAQDVPGNIHHANFGRHLKAEMDKIGVECIQRMDTDYDGDPQAQFAEIFEFVKQNFGMGEG